MCVAAEQSSVDAESGPGHSDVSPAAVLLFVCLCVYAKVHALFACGGKQFEKQLYFQSKSAFV